MEREENRPSFTSRTVMGKEEGNKLQQLLQSLIKSPDSSPFRVPVDWQALNLLDYPVLIRKPMDLATVHRKILNDNYEYVEDCLEDTYLIWRNAKIYNPKENQIHKLAQKLEKLTKKMIKNYLPFVKLQTTQGRKKQVKKESKYHNCSLQQKAPLQPKNYKEKKEEQKNETPSENFEEPPHFVQRKNFLFYIHLCSSQQIGVIFLLVKNNCPEALKYDEDGTVNLLSEKIEDSLMKRVNNLLSMWGIIPKASVTSTFRGRRK